MTTRILNWLGNTQAEPSSGLWMDDLNPATSQVIAQIPRSSAADVQAAVESAREGARVWGSTPPQVRADTLRRIADGIDAELNDLALLESTDQGKPVSLARMIDIPRASANMRFFAGALEQETHQSSRHVSARGAALNYTSRKPIGVVGLITPWNLPLYLLTWKVGPALAMGNAVVAKPSELTPLTADALGRICKAAGLPDGVFNLVHGLGPEVGQAIVEHPEIKAISFTGGTATGRRVAATAAPMVKKLSLELGGKNATLVFEDADLDKAVDGAVMAGFSNQGEICLCGSRLLVQAGIYEEFVQRFVERVAAIRVGDPAAADTQMGALNSLAHRDKVEGYLELALQEGGQILCGGKRPDLPAPFDQGAFLQPAVIADLDIGCRTATEEIFGPVVTVHPFEDEQQALQMANGTEYGLAASIWTRDLQRAHRVSEALDVGMVWVNTWLIRDLRVPFGGVKNSGVGREGGAWSMRFYSEDKNVCVML